MITFKDILSAAGLRGQVRRLDLAPWYEWRLVEGEEDVVVAEGARRFAYENLALRDLRECVLALAAEPSRTLIEVSQDGSGAWWWYIRLREDGDASVLPVAARALKTDALAEGLRLRDRLRSAGMRIQ